MNKSESKYFNTALLMDEAIIALLKEKDLEYITVKEICKKAGVNRSTFYLHYETIADLVDEAIEFIYNRFLSYFAKNMDSFADKISTADLKSLVLVTQDYLLPYLEFIRENKNVYRAAFRNPNQLQVNVQYSNLKKYILQPILRRYEVPEAFHKYYIAYYIEGIIAIIKEWLNSDCLDSVEVVAAVIEECVRPSDTAKDPLYEK